jgi:hypothetical protein
VGRLTQAKWLWLLRSTACVLRAAAASANRDGSTHQPKGVLMENAKRNAMFLLASLVCASAMAQGCVGVSAGQSKVDVDCSGTITCDDSDNAYKIFGGYLFSPNFGIEGAYYNQGKVKEIASDPQLGNVSAELKGDGFGLYGIGVLPFDKLLRP